MDKLTLRHYNTLEFFKVLELLKKQAVTADGKELAQKTEPAHDIFSVERLLDETVTAYKLIAKYSAPSFSGAVNISGQLSRAQSGGCLSAGELLSVASVLRAIRSLSQWRDNHCPESEALLPYFSVLFPNKYLEDRITSAIISEEEISDHASPALYDIRKKKRAQSSKIRDKLDGMIHSKTVQKYLQEPIVTIRDGRFVVPVKAECRSEVAGLVHDTSSTGSTVFIEPMSVVEANNQIKILESKEREEIDRILAELSSEAAGFAESIKAGYEAVVRLDVIFAKGKLAFDMKASEPVLNDSGKIDLKKARHPLIDPKKVVATDIRLGKDFDTLIITGPNTGGKTVTLKTIGLLTLMAMCGMMIPAADESEISVFGRVLVDIGDEQSIEQSLSTFSAHMTNIIEIFKVCDKRSLVLLDELGAGTDPTEGAALATAIINELRGRGAKIAATTHYPELKAYALETAGVENACCEFDVKTLSPTYRLLIGLPGKSNAFAILSHLGMNKGIIEEAQKLVSGDTRKFERVVETLQQSHAGLETEREKARQLRAKAEELAEKSRKDREELEKERAKIIEAARKQARDITESARAESSRLIGELEDIKKQSKTENAAEMLKRAKAAAKRGMEKTERAADPVEKNREKYKLPRPLKEGDNVLIADIDKKAVVLSPPDKSGNCFVQAGIIKTKVSVDNLRLLESEKNVIPESFKERQVRGVESRALRKVSTELDIRGMASDEGIMEVDNFIDGALLSGIETITIIHGKGTGVLKNAVRTHLKNHRSIKSFRRGMYGEGEDGVTIATLK